MCAAKKTSCWRCMSWVHTAPWTVSQGIKDSLELHIACFTQIHTNKPKCCSCYKQYSSCSAYLCGPRVSGLHQQVSVGVWCAVMGPSGAACLALSPTHEGQPQGAEVYLSPSRGGHTRNLALETVKCWWPASICPALRQKTQSHHGDRRSTATGAADAGLWMDCTTAGRADPRIQISFRPISCDAPMWASHF